MSVRSKSKQEDEKPAESVNDEIELPEGWIWAKLGDLGQFINGDRGKNYPSKEAFVANGVPFINAGHLRGGVIDFSEMNYISEDHFRRLGSGKVEPNDVLYCLRGSLGKAAIVCRVNQGAIASSLVIIRPTSGGLSRLLYYFLVSPLGKDEILKYDNGSAQPNLSAKSVQDYAIPLPPFSEQKRIVSKLELLLGKVSSSQQRLARVPVLLKRFRQSVLAAACSGKLTADWREENPDIETSVDFLATLRLKRASSWISKGTRKCPEPIPHDTEDLPEVPESWVWTSADAICSQVTDGEHIQPPYRSEGKPMLSAKHVRDGYVTLEGAGLIAEADFQKCLERCEPLNGDILIVSVGATTGRTAIVEDCPPFAIVRSVLHLRPLCPPRFLLRWLQSPWCRKWTMNASGASAQPHLYIKDTRRLPVPFPPLAEQQEIVRRVEKLFAFADQIEARLKKAQAHVDRLTQSLLAKAFQGKLVPTEAELARREGRDFESASALLDRIKNDQSSIPSGTKHASKRSPSSSRP